jgi:hypothetical protein
MTPMRSHHPSLALATSGIGRTTQTRKYDNAATHDGTRRHHDGVCVEQVGDNGHAMQWMQMRRMVMIIMTTKADVSVTRGVASRYGLGRLGGADAQGRPIGAARNSGAPAGTQVGRSRDCVGPADPGPAVANHAAVPGRREIRPAA